MWHTLLDIRESTVGKILMNVASMEKLFFHESHLIIDQNIHIGEVIYEYNVCLKAFMHQTVFV